ncbi:unnamed protein product [Tuber aestivum]|uniref:Het-C-domain-containing protein n=1 Tax=Tuber aestivum TaxID=59557 RepID=A0A292Q327_9PEZI|nr:unnamed protein product [Tuber aestivum]
MPSTPLSALLLIGTVLLFATPAWAFGAGNIVNVSQVAGKNWRHGDIEEALLELFLSQAGSKKFDRLNVKRVYFGNWLRDYSQAVDVGGLKQLPKDAIRVLVSCCQLKLLMRIWLTDRDTWQLWVLSFITFGFATGEFEVTEERLGCYRPEEHIDNPKGYAGNEDARKYDCRLRGPVDEGKELAVDERTGLKAYIASEDRGMDTSAGLVRRRFEEAIEKGRAYGRDGRDVDLYEALRLLGTGLHCLEDYAAHSNYCELALRELGPQVYPHVGEQTEIEVNGKRVFPVVTGTFGMTDFLHSVLGEVSDKMVQSEVQDLDSKLSSASDPNRSSEATSTLKGILDNIPWALLGIGGDFGSEADRLQQNANAKKLERTSIQPKMDVAGYDMEEMKRQTEQTVKDIFPILEFHDKVIKAFQTGIDKIPGASALMENLTGAMQIYVFSILAPYIKPILERTKAELAAGSGGVLAASEKAQFEVFEDENCSDPTHSILSKDHFTNILNPVAGRVASATISFAVPLVVSAWDDSNKDTRQIIDDILQVFHHPALKDENRAGQHAMFEAVKKWWEEKDESQRHHLEEALSKQGVRDGKNHEGEDPNPGPGGCGHSHEGIPGGGVPASRSSGNRQFSSGGDEASRRESSYGTSGRDREEASTAGGGYGSVIDPGTSSYGSTETGYSSHRQNQGADSYDSSRRDNGSYGSAGGGYGSNTRGSYGSSYTRDSDNPQGRAGSHEHTGTSSYGGGSGAGRSGYDNESPSYPRSSGENTTSYGREEQISSYGRAVCGEEAIPSSYGIFGHTEGGGSYTRSGGSRETAPPGRSGRGEEVSPHGRMGQGESSSTYRRSSFSGGIEEPSYGRSGHSYGSRDTDTSEYGPPRRTDEGEGQGYGRRGVGGEGYGEEYRGYGY